MGHQSSAVPMRMVVSGRVVNRTLGATLDRLTSEPQRCAQTLTVAAESATV
jgi:hypothetical protein